MGLGDDAHNTAWDITRGDPSVVVAILDTGIKTNGLSDFDGQIASTWNVLGNSTDVTINAGNHGTYVAGIAGLALGNNSGSAGFCPGCKLMIVQVGTDSGAYLSDLASGLTWAADHGARVANMSWAGSSDTATLQNATTYAHSKGVVMTASGEPFGGPCPQIGGVHAPGIISEGWEMDLTEPVLLTPEGLEKLKRDLEVALKRRAEAGERLKEAFQPGDIEDNPEYEQAKEEVGMLDSRIYELQEMIGRAQIIKDTHSSVIGPGSTIEVVDTDGDAETYHLVGAVESDPSVGRISVESPVGRALVGRKKGDKITVSVPSGTLTLTIKAVK